MTRIPARTLKDSVVRPASVAEGSVLTVLRVHKEVAGMRLDRFVASQLTATSRSRSKGIIARCAYGPQGERLRPGQRVLADQHIYLWRPPWDDELPDVDLPILYEDEQVLAVDKPAHTPVHPTARYYRSTVVKLLEAERPDQRFMLAHRLDRETSGVLLVSKTPDADRHIKRQFAGVHPITRKPDPRGRRVDKEYLALTHGWPTETEFRVNLPLERDLECRLRVKMRVASPGEGLAASTACTVVERRQRAHDGARYALVRCGLETGRQHQIRIHLASVGLPLVGEKLYGPDDGLFARAADGELSEADHAQLEISRHALHAAYLELDHPSEPRRLSLRSPMPGDLSEFWDALEPAP